jgi:ketosteroid isomerase-like protein
MKQEILLTLDGSAQLHIPDMKITFHSIHSALREKGNGKGHSYTLAFKNIMMNKILLLPISILISCMLFAQKTKPELAIQQVLDNQMEAWNRGDIAAFMEGYLRSDSLIFVGSSGPQYGWQNTYDRYLRTYDTPEKMGKLTFTVVQMSMLGKKHCRMLGKWHLARTIGDVGGYFTLIWQRTNKGWKIIADHTS